MTDVGRILGIGVVLCLSPACEKSKASSTPQDAEEESAALAPDPVEAAAQKLAAGDVASALTILDRALQDEPQDPELWFAKGVALQQGADQGGAMGAWEHALTLKPDYFAALHGLGTIHLERQEYPQAAERFRAALVVNPEFADAHYNLALALLGVGDREAAAKALDQAARLAPTDVDVLIQLSDLQQEDGKLEEAVATAERATELAKNDALAWATLGRARLRAKDPQAALVAFETAKGLAPDDLAIRLGWSQAALKTGDFKGAAAELESLSTVASESAVVWLEWGTALAQLGAFGPALEKIDRALALDPDFTAAKVRRVGVLVDGKRCTEARKAVAAMKGLGEAAERAARSALAPCTR